jgi:hypothetical protein
MLRLSATALKDLFSCEKMYYYRVHHSEAATLSDDIIFGNVIHNVIAKTDNISNAMHYASELWKDKTQTDFLGHIKKPPKDIEKVLNNYYTKILPTLGPRTNALIEHSFEIPWREDVKVVGKWDRIDRECVYDWKTGTNVPDIYTMNDIQFHIYWWAYRKIFKNDPKELYYGHLGNGKVYNIGMNSAYLTNVELLLDKAAKQVYNGGEARETGYQCRRCLYRGICWEEFVNESRR